MGISGIWSKQLHAPYGVSRAQWVNQIWINGVGCSGSGFDGLV